MASSRKGASTARAADARKGRDTGGAAKRPSKAAKVAAATASPSEPGPKRSTTSKATPPWMRVPTPTRRKLRVYALDPSAGNFVGNVMTLNVQWERSLKPGPIGRKIAVIDYDAANNCYYPPVDLDDPHILARDGLDPSESDPRFHQQMVYAVALQTVEKFEAALGRSIHWRRGERPADTGKLENPSDDIWVLKLYPHALAQANAFYCRDAQGILFGYFRAAEKNQGNNLPGQRVFTCLSHDIIAHEMTHAVIDGIRKYFTEPTNPDVLAFHEAFADLTALFLHFSHKEALLDTLRKTGGRLYQFELTPDAAPVEGSSRTSRTASDGSAAVRAEVRGRNPLVELAQQFGQATGAGHALRAALDAKPDPAALDKCIGDPHTRGSILVAAVFDAYFSTYLQAAADLFRVYRAGGNPGTDAELPSSLANLLAETASKTADDFFQLCARALDYCPPVDITFGDFLRALMTASIDLRPEADRDVRQALMQAFRVRGIYPADASFFSEDALVWPKVPEWSWRKTTDLALPAIIATIIPEGETQPRKMELQFAPRSLTREQSDNNGMILRAWAKENLSILGFDAAGPDPVAASFHQVARFGADGRLRVDMVIELVQTLLVPFDPEFPDAGSFPVRGGLTLIVAAPYFSSTSRSRKPPLPRFAIRKPLTGDEGLARMNRQRRFAMSMGLADGDTNEMRHFQANFGLLHEGA